VDEFGALALGDVMRHGQPHLVLWQPARRPADVDDLAVLAHVAVFKLQLQVAFAHAPCLLPRGIHIVGVHQVQHPLAQGL
jgi:hypothetical protein